MSSEAAQKAYPDWGHDPHGMDAERRELQRFAFDRGAVEALRQAAAEFDALGPAKSVSAQEWAQYEVTTATRAFLLRMADEWERGSA